MSRYRLLIILALPLALAACGTAEMDRALSGGAIGAGTGLVIGGPVGALLGGSVGAVAGAATEPDDLYLGDPVWD